MSSDDRFQRENINHLKNNPKALEEEYKRIQKEEEEAHKEWDAKQRELEKEAFRKAGFDVDKIYNDKNK